MTPSQQPVRECFDQAALVAQRYPFDKKKVRKWFAREGSPETYDKLLAAIRKQVIGRLVRFPLRLSVNHTERRYDAHIYPSKDGISILLIETLQH